MDIELVQQAKNGDRNALLQLIMEQKDDYYRLAYSYMGNQHDAMDALEDMIVTVYEKLYQLKKPDAFYSWSKKILVNTCKTHLRNIKKVVLINDWSNQKQGIKKTETTTNPFSNKEQQLDLYQLLERLSPSQRDAITLRYLHDYDYQTIAEMTNVSLGTVKSRIFQGLKKLNKMYGGDRYE